MGFERQAEGEYGFGILDCCGESGENRDCTYAGNGISNLWSTIYVPTTNYWFLRDFLVGEGCKEARAEHRLKSSALGNLDEDNLKY